MATTLRCINASGQPRLTLDGYYELVLDVQKAYRPGGTRLSRVTLSSPKAIDVAIPYVYNRKPFYGGY